MIYEFIILIIGWLYPAFATYSSLSGNQYSQLSWMKYWIVFGIFTAFHFFTGCLESLVPFFAGFKLCVLLWLLPSLGGGSHLIHDEFVDPLLSRNKMMIHQAFNGISDMSSALLREMVKIVYHLLVDVVEQCWQMTRNADDIHVTPRLQAAINDVIAELRAARQAATRHSHAHSHPHAYPYPFPYSQHHPHPEQQLQQQQEQEQLQLQMPLPLPPMGTEPKPSPISNPMANSTPIPMPIADPIGATIATVPNLTDDDIQLRILLAEAASAMRMQLSMQSANQEHLAPINSCLRPVKPKRGKRNKESQLEQMEDVDRVYREYRRNKKQQH